MEKLEDYELRLLSKLFKELKDNMKKEIKEDLLVRANSDKFCSMSIEEMLSGLNVVVRIYNNDLSHIDKLMTKLNIEDQR